MRDWAVQLAHSPSHEALDLSYGLQKINLRIVRSAAAAENGEGIDWDEHDVPVLNEAAVAVLKTDALAPIGFIGQYLILDPRDKPPENSDLVVVSSGSGQAYARRIWFEEDARILLEGANTNVTLPSRMPIQMASIACGVWQACCLGKCR